MPASTDLSLTRRRTPWTTVLGLVLVVIGIGILANAAVATRVSVQFLGWMLLLAGVAGLLAALLGMRSGGVAANAIGSGVLLVLGLMCLRNVEAAAVTLTLVAGALFLLTGLVRVIAAVAGDGQRLGLLIGGGVGIVLGLIVLLNLFTASYALLGVLIGIQVVGEGLTMVLLGGLAMTTSETEPVASSS